MPSHEYRPAHTLILPETPLQIRDAISVAEGMVRVSQQYGGVSQAQQDGTKAALDYFALCSEWRDPQYDRNSYKNRYADGWGE